MSENDDARRDPAARGAEDRTAETSDAEGGSAADAVNRAGQAATEAIPGEDPEDNPDAEGEERFDAG